MYAPASPIKLLGYLPRYLTGHILLDLNMPGLARTCTWAMVPLSGKKPEEVHQAKDV